MSNHRRSTMHRAARQILGRLLGLLLAVAVLGASALGPSAFCTSAYAVEVEFAGRPVKRDILALYDGRHETAPHLTRIHRFAEMPLNWMGFKLTYRDVRSPLPDAAEMERYRGILTWFLEPMRNSDAVLRWLDAATQRPLRYVVIGEIGPGADPSNLPVIQRIAGRIGLDFKGENNDLGYNARVVAKDDALIGFERPLDKVLTSYPVLRARQGEARAHLTIAAPRSGTEVQSDVVVSSPRGAFAVYDFTTFYEFTTDRARWIVDPFAFFRLGFGDDRFPVPDVTTLAGRRMYFSHIDGDGWNNLSEIESWRAKQATAAEVIAAEAIEPYPDLPVSVGLISGDALPLLGGTQVARRVARRLYALPQVEVASHTHTHPFDWSFFESYDRSAEEQLVDKFNRPAQPIKDRIRSAIAGLAGTAPATPTNDKYIAGSSDLPRTYLKAPFDLELEVRGALRAAESFAPPGKKAKLYLWSGNTTPFEAAIRATRSAGVRNMNGGDSRFDQEYPSVTYVPPVGRQIGRERQIYAGNSNENTYTNDWLGPYYGFFKLDQTLDNTDAPRRLKPFNLYYHMYSGEKPASLASVRHFLERARKTEVIPVAASDYAAIADSFYDVEIEQVNVSSWVIAKRGSLSTVRFDAAQDVGVDYADSEGVLGATSHRGSLYVALDPSVDRAVVTLRQNDGGAKERAPFATLVQSRWQILRRTEETCGLKLQVQGYGHGDMVWSVAPGLKLDVTLARGERQLYAGTATSGADGRLSLALAADAIEPAELRLSCHG